MTRSALEQSLDRELAAFLQEEYAIQGEEFYQWYRLNFVPRNIGLAPYDWAIADFVTGHWNGFGRFVEIGAGIGQQSMLLATRGHRVVALDGEESHHGMAQRAFTRVEARVFPELRKYMTQAYAWFPEGGAEYVTDDTLLCFPTLSATTTPEQDLRILDLIGKAGGVILTLHHFFRPRDTQTERDEVIAQLRARGFEAPVPVTVPTDGHEYMPGHIVFMKKRPRGSRWSRWFGG